MKRSLEQCFSELYISNLDIIGEGLPTRINAARSGYLESLNILSLPSKKDERYRHCDMRELFEGDWEYYFTPSPVSDSAPEHIPVEGYRIDITNGFHVGDEALTTLDNGIVFGSLREAMLNMEDKVAEHYNSAADNDNEAVVALNSAFTQDGAFVYIPDGVESDYPFVLTFSYSSDEQARMCFSRALIIVERGAKASISISHINSGKAKFLVDHVRETILGEGANLNISEISLMRGGSSAVYGNYLKQAGDSSANMMNIWFEGGVTRVNSVINLEGRGCESNLHGLYFGTKQERTDISVTVNHLVPDCNSYEVVKGVVSDNAIGSFTGKVYVARDAQRTNAFQQSRNLQLSDTAKIYTEPQLEIYADDVKCSHGATVGQMDSDAIYYMRQRGLSEVDARKLQLFGFVNDIISHCPVEAACGPIRDIAQRRIEDL